MASDITAGVYALVRDLLPILVPGATFDGETGSVLLPLAEGRARVSCESLVTACAGQPNHLWPRTVDEWLKAMRVEVGDALVSDQSARPELLRMRLTPRRGDADAGAYVVLPYGAFFDAVVVVDYPTRTRRLTRDEAAGLGLDPKQAVNLAIRQTISQELQHLDIRDLAGTWVRMVARDGPPYVSAVLLSVDGSCRGEHQSGVLVAVPRYSTVLLHRLTSDAALRFASVLPKFGRLDVRRRH